ncbi:MAG: hypothetical protein J7559_12580 [Cohnella sp.]|nr:hypothetical protein [Cohnella sp.]
MSNGVKITKVASASASGTTAINGTAVDMTGYEGVLFFTTVATANAGNFLKAQIGAASDGSDGADLEGSKVVPAADGNVAWVDVYHADPSQKYIRPVVVRGAATIVGEIYALQYESRKQAINNNVANTIIGKLIVGAYEGTA